jgi:hypothetical protein
MNTEKSSRKSMKRSSSWLVGGLSLFFIAVALATLVLAQVGPRRMVRHADERNREAYDAYVRGTFNEATNALIQYVQFLESHEKQLSPYRNTDLLLVVANQDMAYMSMCSGDETAASFHLNVAYERHKRLRTKANRAAMPRSEYVQFVINEVDREDAVTNVAWRSTFALNPVAVSNVMAAFKRSGGGTKN